MFQQVHRRRVLRIAAVYIVGAFVALQVADLAFPGLSIPDTAILYVWIGAVLGFPFALFLGWRFDLVDGRILRSADSSDAPGVPLGKSDRITLFVTTVSLIAICVGLAVEIVKTRVDDPARVTVTDAPPNSVAVLPFDNIGRVHENEYLADGLTETLLHALAQASNLMVTARTSSFFYKGKDIDIREIAGQLGVSNVLEGSVQQNGDRIRVVAQLIEADTGFHRWSNTYDFDLDDVFAVQDSIASSVAIAILASVTAAPELGNLKLTGVSTTSIEAYQKYVEALEQARIRSNSSLPAAETLFRRALTVDPDFVEAKRELAYTLLDMLLNGTLPVPAALERLRPLRDELLAAYPDDGVSIIVDTWYRVYEGRSSVDIDPVISKLIAAIERSPNDIRVYTSLATGLGYVGREDDAIELLNRAIVIDPMDSKLYFALGDSQLSTGNFQAAIESFERGIELNPKYPSGRSTLAWAKWATGDYVNWYQEFQQAAALDPLDHEMEMGMVSGLVSLGLYEDAARHIARADEINAKNGGEWFYSTLLALLGDSAEALALSESYLRIELEERGSGHLASVMVYVSAIIDEGKTQEALVTFEEIYPGITTEDYSPSSVDEFRLQFWATVAWAWGKDTGQITTRLDKLRPRWEKIAGLPRLQTNWVYTVPGAFLRDDLDEASRHAVESLTSRNPFALFAYRHVYPFTVVAKLPAVAAHLDAIEEKMRPGKVKLQAYLADLRSDTETTL